MGWLFALSLGLQEKTRLAVFNSLGHAAAISLTILGLRIVQEALSPGALKLAVAAVLIGMGLYRLSAPVIPGAGE